MNKGVRASCAPSASVHHKEPLPSEVREFARHLRMGATDAETRLWYLLRGRRLAGFKFRRQHPISGYVLDFYCEARKLAIEVDGGEHAREKQIKHDKKRERVLGRGGIMTLRFWDNDVLTNTEAVLERIWDTLIYVDGSPSP